MAWRLLSLQALRRTALQPDLWQRCYAGGQKLEEAIRIHVPNVKSILRAVSNPPPVNHRHAERQFVGCVHFDIAVTPRIELRLEQISDHIGIMQRSAIAAIFFFVEALEELQQCDRGVAASGAQSAEPI